MNNTIFRKTILGAFILITSFASQTFAQDSTMIKEVKITQNDGFKELKSLLDANFDYQDVDAYSGVYNSEVHFAISKDGKLENIMASGASDAVNKEIEQTLKELAFTFDKEMLTANLTANTYVLPVQLVLER